jgi:hypothetical protein
MSSGDIEIKQHFLRSEIFDKGYDTEKFSEYFNSISDKGLDIEAWTIEELREIVLQFQSENDNINNYTAPSNNENIPSNETITQSESNNTTTTSNQPFQEFPPTKKDIGDFITCQKQERNTFTNMSKMEIIITE